MAEAGNEDLPQYGAALITNTNTLERPYVERLTSDPQRVKASPSVPPETTLGLILGVMVAAMVTVLVICLKIRRLFTKQSRGHQKNSHEIVAEESDNTGEASRSMAQPSGGTPPTASRSMAQPSGEEGVSSPRQPSHHADSHVAAEDDFQEPTYINSQFQIKRENLEAYLLRAVMSCETKIEFESVPPFLSSPNYDNEQPDYHHQDRCWNNVTYPHTRVLLPLYCNIPHTDYIDANYVRGPNHPAAFIATEGPKEETVGAFWRMIWHSQCSVILMVANLQEGQQVKVVQYWPEEQPWIIEGIIVTATGVTVNMDFVKRTFTISVGNTHREVKQYQCTTWPDHGVPQTPYGLAQMIKLVYREHRREGPITVHCGDGIGRTGTVILLMYLLDQLQTRDAVNPSGALKILRRCRGRLVENTEQYVFAHQLLYEVVFGMKTAYFCNFFNGQLNGLRAPQFRDGISPLQKQYQKLESLPKHLSFKHGNHPDCAVFNRNQDILPADERMVWLQQKQGYGTYAHYLNVIRINGIDQKDAYLFGEHPQKRTLGRMWRLVYERRVAVWVLVHTFHPHDPEFPDVVDNISNILGNMTLRVTSTYSFEDFDEQNVDINVTEQGKVITHRCLLIRLRGWSAAYSLPASPDPLLSVIERAEAFSSPQNPPLFTCKDGVTGCGVVAALLLAMSRVKLLQEVDIYRSVATVQQERHQFIVNLEQYDFLHDAMVAFLRDNELYSNFK